MYNQTEFTMYSKKLKTISNDDKKCKGKDALITRRNNLEMILDVETQIRTLKQQRPNTMSKIHEQ